MSIYFWTNTRKKMVLVDANDSSGLQANLQHKSAGLV